MKTKIIANLHFAILKYLFGGAVAAVLLIVGGATVLAQSSGGDVTSGSSVVITAAPRGKDLRAAKPTKRPAAAISKKPKSVKATVAAAPAGKKLTVTDSQAQKNHILLNEEAVTLPLPVWTRAAKEAQADGLVQIDIEIDEQGNVTSAVPRTGNELLWESAKQTALQAKFNPKTAKRKGYLMFCFGDHPDCH